MRCSASFECALSIEQASVPGRCANHDGSIDRSGGLDTSNASGNQLNPPANRGLSDFDRPHHFVFSYAWDLPEASVARRSVATRVLFSNWQVAGIVSALSGLPVDIFDPTGGLLYGLFGARPNWAAV